MDAHARTHILLWNSCNNNSPLPPSPPQLCSPHPSIPLPCGHLLLILKLIWEPPALLYKEMYCAQIIWLFSDVGPFLHKRGRTGFVQSRRLLGPWMDTPGGGGEKRDRRGARGADTRVRKWPLQCKITNKVLSQLLQSLLWNIPLLRQPRGWRLKEEGRKDRFSLLFLLNAASIQRVC